MSATSARPCPRCGASLDGAGWCTACSARPAPVARSGAALLDLELSGLPAELPDLSGLPAELPPPAAPCVLPHFGGQARTAAHLPGLPELPGDDEPHPASRGPASGQAATAIASAWRSAPQEIYGCKPFELELLVNGVLADPAQSSPEGSPRWTQDQLAARAEYGPAPDGRISAIAYALHVARRRRDLREQAAVAARHAEDARARGKTALAEVGQAIFERRAEAERGSLAQRVDAAARALAQVQERRLAQTALGEQAAAELARHDAAIAEAEHAAEPDRLHSAKAEDAVAVAQREAERAAALHKRAEIEIRAAQSASEPSPQRIERAQADRQTRAGELARAQETLVAAEAALADAQDAVAVHGALIAALRAKRHAAADAHAHEAGAAQGALGDASAQQREALCGLASAALLQNLAPKANAEAAIAALRNASTARDEAVLSLAAIDAYDEDAYRTGVTTAAALAVALLALLVWLSI